MSVAAIVWLALSLAAALYWLLRLIAPAQRRSGWFIYNADTPADAFDTAFGGARAPITPITDWPAVTIVVPGRNEGHVLRATLGSLCRLDYPKVRIIFVDDQSTDDTAAIADQLAAEFPHLAVLHNTISPPAGWVGKNWAIQQAHDQLAGDYILFTDSDLLFHPQSLRQMIRLAEHRRNDLTSMLPYLDCRGAGETMAMLGGLWLISMKYPLTECNDPRHPNCITAGGFMLFRRAAYEAIGGHAAARGQVIEDIALGRMVKNQGMRVFTVSSQELMGGRMYEGTRDAYYGLKKNAYAGASYRPTLFMLAAIFLLTIGALTPLYPIIGGIFWSRTHSTLWLATLLAGLIAYLAQTTSMTIGSRLLRLPWYAMWLAPGAAIFYLVIMTASMIDYYRGGNVWSGRKMQNENVESLAVVESAVETDTVRK